MPLPQPELISPAAGFDWQLAARDPDISSARNQGKL
jgi:hypothetical protein